MKIRNLPLVAILYSKTVPKKRDLWDGPFESCIICKKQLYSEDWTCENMHDTCVKLYKTDKTWQDARDFCVAIGADLPSVPSSTYQAWVID